MYTKKFHLFLLINFALGCAAGWFIFRNIDYWDVWVVGRRAGFILTEKTPLNLSTGGQALTEEDGFIEATVTCCLPDKRFIAAAHPTDGSAKGYGFLKAAPVATVKGELSQVFSASKADLEVDSKGMGIFGTVRHPIPGFPAKLADPKPGTALILLSNNIGTTPVPTGAYVLPELQEGIPFQLYLPLERVGPGNSGSPVIQFKSDGEINLVGVVFGSKRADGRDALAMPIKALVNNVR